MAPNPSSTAAFAHAASFDEKLAVASLAQQQPRAPRDTTTVNVNGKPVSIAFGRPSLAGRTIDELIRKLPADRMWRIGANN